MEGLDKITSRIIEDAENTAARIDLEAEQKAKAHLADAEEFAQNLLAENRVSTKEDAAAMLARAESLRRSERRKIALAERQGRIERVLEAALAKLAADPAEVKIPRYAQMIKAVGISKGEIVLNLADQSLGARLLAEVEGDFSLSKEIGDFSSGLIIKAGKIVDNLTYDLAMANSLNELTKTAAELLEEK